MPYYYGLKAGTEVNETIDNAHGGARALFAAEIHGGRAGKQAVRTDDAYGHHEHQETQHPAAVEEGYHKYGADEGHQVEQARRRRWAPGRCRVSRR